MYDDDEEARLWMKAAQRLPWQEQIRTNLEDALIDEAERILREAAGGKHRKPE